ncbi:MAG: hypothetical protein O7D34_02405 [Ignavibacteria bacterium]|nr:hypothetical protein [Ignavibacteria bacterium]
MDRDIVRAASKAFTAKFPSYDKLRHGVAHAGEFKKTPEKQKQHAIKGDYEGHGMKFTGAEVFVSDHLNNSTFATGFQGNMLSYDVTQETLDNLRGIRDKFFGALQEAPSDSD